MAVTSMYFMAFLLLAVAVYYIVPVKFRWIALLAASVFFYLEALGGDWQYIIYIISAALVIYLAGIWIGKVLAKQKTDEKADGVDKEQRRAIKARSVKIRRRIMVPAILIILLLLVSVKYLDFITGNINSLLSLTGTSFKLPIINLVSVFGISYYTLMLIGYIVDVYRGKNPPQKNFFKFLTFTMFFPHITQGPISRYDQLASQIFRENRFDFENIKMGIQLMVWGFFKKLVIADRMAVFINEVYGNYREYDGAMLLFASMMFSIQIYADFSGYTDIVAGAAKMFGIDIAQNFNHPIFSKNMPEFWRRWHMSLSFWFKDYVFYPLSVSKLSLSLSKSSRKHLGATAGRVVSSCFPLFVVWVTTGLWHGASWKFAAWGLYQGVLIMGNVIFGQALEKLSHKLHIKTETFSWRLWQMIRTFMLTSIGRVFFRASSFSASLVIFKKMFTDFNIAGLFSGSIFKISELNGNDFIVLILSCFVLLVVSNLQEHMKVREKLAEQNLVFRWIIYLLAVFVIIIFGYYGPGFSQAEFIYEKF